MCAAPGAIRNGGTRPATSPSTRLLVDAGLSLPDGVLIDDRFRGMSAEQIYNLLESESEQEQDAGNEGGKTELGQEARVIEPSPAERFK